MSGTSTKKDETSKTAADLGTRLAALEAWAASLAEHWGGKLAFTPGELPSPQGEPGQVKQP